MDDKPPPPLAESVKVPGVSWHDAGGCLGQEADNLEHNSFNKAGKITDLELCPHRLVFCILLRSASACHPEPVSLLVHGQLPRRDGKTITESRDRLGLDPPSLEVNSYDTSINT